MGAVRTARTLTRLNQRDGFDCPGAPGRSHRGTASTRSSARTAPRRSPRRPRPRTRDARSSSPRTRSPSCASAPTTGSASRAGSPQPMVLRPGRDALRADRLGRRVRADRRASCGPGLAGRGARSTPRAAPRNEAAFVYQLMVRAFGTNNLPDCSNMCHESSRHRAGRDHRHRQGLGVARRPRARRPDPGRRAEPGHQPPADALGAGEGQAPTARRSSRSTRCPRPGCCGSRTRRRSHGVVGDGIAVADEFLQIRIGGDLALFQALANCCSTPRTPRPGTVVDHDVRRPAHRRASTHYAAAHPRPARPGTPSSPRPG